MRRLLVGTFAGVASLAGVAASAGEIQSALTVVRSLDDAVQFDLPVDGVALPASTKLTGLRLEWVAKPGRTEESAQVVAGIAAPRFDLGDRLEGAMVASLPAQGEAATTSEATFADANGLPFGVSLFEQIAAEDAHIVSLELFTSGAGAEAMKAFFDGGGTIEARMALSFDLPSPSGPGGGNVPEPMSLGVWATTGFLGVAFCRRTKHAARLAETARDVAG